MQRFDKKAVQALLTEVVRKRGEDFVYGTGAEHVACEYTRDGKPSCGIGQMLSDIGVAIPTLVRMDKQSSDTNINSRSTLNILKGVGFIFTEGAVVLMYAFQRWQDQEHPYGLCLEHAKAGHVDPFDRDGNPPF